VERLHAHLAFTYLRQAFRLYEALFFFKKEVIGKIGDFAVGLFAVKG
jgi:hypothetical protein